ncbi:hypothetical protein [Streptomyces sp. NPDC006012]|uniref:hypothetical protein n=1 Tax=Streptomyces sp. NPDC006012 TaxID=3364739 RepID=UPI0036B9C406
MTTRTNQPRGLCDHRPEAERRAAGRAYRTPAPDGGHAATLARTDHLELAAALRDIERVQRLRGPGVTIVRERLAARLRWLAQGLEGRR